MKNVFNKLVVVGAVVLLVAISVSASIKFGTDSTGQSWYGQTGGLITCSNGKAFPATGAGMQSAIYSLNGSGGTVYCSSGNISGTNIKINGDIVIQGDAHEYSNVDLKGTHFFNTGSTPMFNITSASADHKVTFKNLMITGRPTSGDGIYSTYCEELNVFECSIKDNGHDGIYLRFSYVVYITNCDIRSNGGAGVNVTEGSKATIDGCHMGSNLGNGDVTVISGSVTMDKCYFEHYHATSVPHLKLAGLASGARAIVSDCTFYSTFDPANVDAVYIDDNNWAMISNCYFVENKRAINCNNGQIIVTNCKFRLSSSITILVTQGSHSSIMNNDIYIQIASVPAMEGISVAAGVDYCRIISNAIYASTAAGGDGIIVYGSRCIVESNTIYQMSDGIYFRAASDNNIAMNNICVSCGTWYKFEGGQVNNLINVTISISNISGTPGPGFSWYSTATHKLYVYEGAGVWKSSTFT